MKWRKQTNKQTDVWVPGRMVCVFVWARWLLPPTPLPPIPSLLPPPRESSAMQLLSWADLSHSSLPPSLPSRPHKTHPGQRAGPQPYCGNPRSTEASRKTSSCKDRANELRLLQKSAFVFNGLYVTHQQWPCSALRSSYKSTKRRGQKKGRTAKDEKESQEAFILKEKTETEGSGGHFLFEHSGAEGLERGRKLEQRQEKSGFRDPLKGAGLGCYGAILPRHKVSSAFAATVPVLWAAAAATKKKKIMLLFSNGCWVTEYCVWKGQGESCKRHRKQSRYIPLECMNSNLDGLWIRYRHE